MKYVIMLLLLAGCAKREVKFLTGKQGEKGVAGSSGVNGIDGVNGVDGVNGQSCTVSATTNGAIISCPDGSFVEIKNGKDCKKDSHGD